MRSLRSRLLLATAIGTATVFSAAGISLYGLIRASLLAEFDRSLGTKARELAAVVEQENDEIEVELDELGMPEFDRTDRPEYFQVWLADGPVLAKSRSLAGGNLPKIFGAPGAPVCQAFALPDGRSGRIAGLRFVPRQEHEKRHKRRFEPQEVILTLARDTAELDGTLARLKLLLAGVCASAIVVAAGVLAWVVRRSLRPVAHLAGQIEKLGESDLSARVDPADAPTELLPVVRRLNDLLQRLEGAFAREKSFTADVAHELRTPLAGLRSTLEVALSRHRRSEAYREAMTESAVITCRVQTMVDNLLSLARAEAGQFEIVRGPVQLDRILRECWGSLAEQARSRRLHVEWQVGQDLMLNTDREKLRVVLQNILDNAVTFANTGGLVRVQAGLRDGRIELSVANTGSELSQQQAEHVFERFWRGDAARSGAGVHCGLGLSLCQKIVTLLGGSISVESAAGGTFRIKLAFDEKQ